MAVSESRFSYLPASLVLPSIVVPEFPPEVETERFAFKQGVLFCHSVVYCRDLLMFDYCLEKVEWFDGFLAMFATPEHPKLICVMFAYLFEIWYHPSY